MKLSNLSAPAVIGVLVGLLVMVSTDNLVLGILACIGAMILTYVVIRLIVAAVEKGVDAVGNAALDAYEKHKEKKENGGEKK